MKTDKRGLNWSAGHCHGVLACHRLAETVLGAPRLLSVSIRFHPWFNSVNT
jgi:hypothetical protein